MNSFWNKIELSFLFTLLGIIFLFMFSVAIVLIAPQFVDKAWIEPTSTYQVQMYEIADPQVYLSSTVSGGQEIETVYHLKKGHSLLAFQESETVHIEAAPELAPYVTHVGSPLILTTRLLLLEPKNDGQKRNFDLYQLTDPKKEEAFAIAGGDPILENWVDQDFTILDPKEEWHKSKGVIYILNPREYRVVEYKSGATLHYRASDKGKSIESLEQLKSSPLLFLSRKELIQLGEDQYKIEGCWYCHTDQTRTLVQDVVLNGSAAYPAPPSSPSEYIYQEVTFPGTKRNGPDLSRTGIKRPSRDWHKGHFWSPKTASKGSIMPAFRHFFDNDPRGTSKSPYGVPNVRFEAIYQYLMTKGTRITAPTQAWWLGRDPIKTIEIIEGKNGN